MERKAKRYTALRQRRKRFLVYLTGGRTVAAIVRAPGAPLSRTQGVCGLVQKAKFGQSTFCVTALALFGSMQQVSVCVWCGNGGRRIEFHIATAIHRGADNGQSKKWLRDSVAAKAPRRRQRRVRPLRQTHC